MPGPVIIGGRGGGGGGAGAAVTQSDLGAAINDLRTQIYGGLTGQQYNTLAKIADGLLNDQSLVQAVQSGISNKQDKSATLTTLAGTNPTAAGIQVMQISSLAALLTAIGGQPAFADGSFATPAEVQASHDDAVTTLRGGVDGSFDTLAKIAASVATKQAASATLTQLAVTTPSNLGIEVLQAADQQTLLTAIGAQPAIGPGAYATPDQVQASHDDAVSTVRGGAPDALNTLAKLSSAIGGDADFHDTVSGAIAAKQDAAANLTTLAAAPAPSTIGIEVLTGQDAPTILQTLGAQPLIPANTYETPSDVDAKISAAKTEIQGGITDQQLSTLKDIADKLQSDESTAAALAGQVAAKQAGDATLTALSGQPTKAYGIGLLNTASAAALLAAIGAQPSGSYQAQDATLTALSAQPTQAYGIGLLNTASAAALLAAISAQKQANVLDQISSQVGTLGSYGAALMAKNIAAGEAGNIYWNTGSALSTITTSVFSRNFLSSANPAAGMIPLTSDANGTVVFTALKTFGQQLAQLDKPPQWTIPIASTADGSVAGTLPTGAFGRSKIALDKPPVNSVPIATDVNGTAGVIQINAGGQAIAGLAAAAPSSSNIYGIPLVSSTGVASWGYLGRQGAAFAALDADTLGTLYYANGTGGLSQLPTTVYTRNLLQVPLPGANAIPITTNTGGTVGTITLGTTGRNYLLAPALSVGSMPFASDTAGSLAYVVSQTFGRSLVTAATGSALKTIMGSAATGFYTSNSLALSTTQAEMISTATTTISQFPSCPYLALTAGRITANSSNVVPYAFYGEIVVDAACEVIIQFDILNASNVAFAPIAGIPAATSSLPGFAVITCPTAGRYSWQGPRGFNLSTTSGYPNVRMLASVASGTANMISFCTFVEQIAATS